MPQTDVGARGGVRPAASGGVREGYLVLADISGYTAFLTGNELEHAQAIISELIQLIRARLAPPLRFVKLEGDAVFCYADAAMLHGGERLLELLEVCYFDFAQLLFNMEQATTCRCAACASIGALDLKFIVHYGTYVVQRDDRGEDLAGADVILAHRLLKNAITERTGAQAYVFFTEASAQQLPPAFKLPRHAETYDPFGETSGRVHDLAPVLREMRDARREYIGAEDADHEAIISVQQPPAVVWQYLVDPVQRLRWACVLFNRDPDDSGWNPRGRSGVGSTSHCNHGPAEAHREIIDWRPFSYFTCRGKSQVRGHFFGPRPIIETFELTPAAGGGTRLAWRVRFTDRSRGSRLMLNAMSLLFRGGIRYGAAKLQRAIEEDLSN